MTNKNYRIDSKYLLDTLKKMISINSVLPREEKLAEFVADELKKIGVKPEWHEVAKGRPNVYARAILGPSDKFLVFSGHSDTVDAAKGWETDPFKPVEQDGRLYGLGVYNMKAGLACMLAAFKALMETKQLHGSLGQLGFAMTVDQEGHSSGARAMLKTAYGRCDAMLHAEHFFGDSEKRYIPIAGTGKVLYKLTVHGRTAHAFRPHLGGINAINDAARIINSLEKLNMKEHELLGKGTICTLKIDGGYKEYSIVVPEQCDIIITRLTVPGETTASAVEDMKELIDSLSLESEVIIETPPPCYDPYFLEKDSPIVAAFENVYKKTTGQSPYFKPHTGITDANVFIAEGNIPTVVFGPKGANHHQPGEYVEISSLDTVAKIYAETAIEYLRR